MKVVTSANERERILKACHSEPTSGHFRLTKTWKRIAERFYWKGIVSDVRQLVSIRKSSLQTSCFTLVLTGTNMPRVPKDEQEAGKGEARAASNSSQVTMAPLWNGFY